MAEYYIRRITVRNKLNAALTNVKVVYGQSKKETGLMAYAFDWRSVNIETGHLIIGKTDVRLPDVPVDGEAGENCNVRFFDGLRGYWQVYFEKDGKSFKINKNNAQVNPWPQDDGKYLEITIRYEGDFIRLDFVMDSGNAYFYAIDYC